MGFFDVVSRGIKILEQGVKSFEIFTTCIDIIPPAIIMLLAIMILSFVFDRYYTSQRLDSQEEKINKILKIQTESQSTDSSNSNKNIM